MQNLKQILIFKVFLFSTAVALLVRVFLLEVFRVESDSMHPTLSAGDLVLTSKINYNLFFPFSNFVLFTLSTPEVASVVIHNVPEKTSQSYIKRVVAIGGDEVQIAGGLLILNGRPAEYTPGETNGTLWEQIGKRTPYQVNMAQVKDFSPIQVPEGYFFVLGDNRADSIDSRIWGPLPQRCLKAKLGMIWSSGLAPTGWRLATKEK